MGVLWQYVFTIRLESQMPLAEKPLKAAQVLFGNAARTRQMSEAKSGIRYSDKLFWPSVDGG